MPNLSLIHSEPDTRTSIATMPPASGSTMFWSQYTDTQDPQIHSQVYVQRSGLDPRLQPGNVCKKRPTPPSTLPTMQRILPVLRTPPKRCLYHTHASQPTSPMQSLHSNTACATSYDLLHCASILASSSKENDYPDSISGGAYVRNWASRGFAC